MKYKNACSSCMTYYPKLKGKICPLCGSALHDVEAMSGEYDVDMTFSSSNLSAGGNSGGSIFDDDFDTQRSEKRVGRNTPLRNRADTHNQGMLQVTGILKTHTENRKVARSIFSKIYDGIVNHQNFSDTTQSFTISSDDGRTYSALVYGEFRGFIPSEGARVEVYGRLNSAGILMVSMMKCDGARVSFYNNNFRAYHEFPGRYGRDERFSRYMGYGSHYAIAILLIAAVLAFLFIPAVKEFILTWLVMLVIVFIAASAIKPLAIMQRKPMIMVAVSFVLTLCFYNVGGIGSGLMTLFGSIGSNVAVIAITGIGLWLLIKSIL